MTECKKLIVGFQVKEGRAGAADGSGLYGGTLTALAAAACDNGADEVWIRDCSETDEDHEAVIGLIKETARAVDAPQLGAPREKTGSTDFGNVLHTLPGACVRIAFVPRGTSSHSQEYLDAGKSDAAHLAVRLAAQILALTSWDVIENEGMLERIRAEFAENLAVMG